MPYLNLEAREMIYYWIIMQMRKTGPFQIVGVTEKFQFVLLSQIGYKHDKKSFDHKKKQFCDHVTTVRYVIVKS